MTVQKTINVTLAAVASLAAVAAATPASAHDEWGNNWRFEIDKRQARQDQLIREGRRNGSLTWFEAQQLRAEQRHIAQMETYAKTDGRITAQERRTIARAQDEATRNIYAERNDSQRRGWLWRTFAN